ncbi:MAG: archease [Woeseiaceae bacterium]|nr:archease [Woeseiaceae bacterium]
MTWSHFAHGADIGLRGEGRSKAEAFEEIARALTGVVTELESVEAEEPVSIRCEAPGDEVLLVDWLNALIYEMAVRRMLFREFEVSIEGGVLKAEVSGEPVDRQKHKPAVEVKGATFTALAVEETDTGWVVQCVVDV